MAAQEMSLKQRVGLELFRRYRRNNGKLHTLRSLFWECTLKCNLNCRHCGSDCYKDALTQDMPKEVFLKAISDIEPHVDPHKTFIIITGGEALLRPDLEQVGLELYRRGFPWGMVSNGYLMDKSRLNSLIASGMHSTTISIDGFENEHNWMRRNPQSYQRAIQAVKLLAQEPEVLWDIVTCVNPQNIDYLSAFRDYLISIGVRYWRLFTIVPMGRAARSDSMQLSDEQFRQLFDFMIATRAEKRIHVEYGCEGFLGPYEGKVRDRYFYCRAGVEVASVLVDGSISGCTSIRSNLHQGNVYTDNLWEVWQNRFQPYRDRAWTRQGDCKTCKVYRYCEGNGMHLYDDEGKLMFCHYKRLGFNKG